MTIRLPRRAFSVQVGNGGRDRDPFHELTAGKPGEIGRLVNMALSYGFDTVIFRMPYGQRAPEVRLKKWINPKGLGWLLHPEVARVMGWLPKHVQVFCYEGAANMWCTGRVTDKSFRMRPLAENPEWERYVEQKCREMASDGFDGIIHDVFHRTEDVAPGSLTKFIEAIRRGAPTLHHVGEPTIKANAPKHIRDQVPGWLETYRIMSAPGRSKKRKPRPYLDEIRPRREGEVRRWYHIDIDFTAGGEQRGGIAELDEWETILDTVSAVNAKGHHAVVSNWILLRR